MGKFVDFVTSERKGHVTISAMHKKDVVGKIETSVETLKSEWAVEKIICKMSYGIMRRKMSDREELSIRKAIDYAVYKHDTVNKKQE